MQQKAALKVGRLLRQRERERTRTRRRVVSGRNWCQSTLSDGIHPSSPLAAIYRRRRRRRSSKWCICISSISSSNSTQATRRRSQPAARERARDPFRRRRRRRRRHRPVLCAVRLPATSTTITDAAPRKISRFRYTEPQSRGAQRGGPANCPRK